MGPAPDFDKTSNTGLRHLWNAARFSLRGLASAFQHESAFRQELAGLIVVIPAAIWLGQSVGDRAVLVAVYAAVLVVELLNSGIEAAVDHTSTDHHELAGRAKDLGSAAVFVTLTLAGLVWLGFLIDRLP